MAVLLGTWLLEEWELTDMMLLLRDDPLIDILGKEVVLSAVVVVMVWLVP